MQNIVNFDPSDFSFNSRKYSYHTIIRIVCFRTNAERLRSVGYRRCQSLQILTNFLAQNRNFLTICLFSCLNQKIIFFQKYYFGSGHGMVSFGIKKKVRHQGIIV